MDALLDYGRGDDDLFAMRRKELSSTSLSEAERRVWAAAVTASCATWRVSTTNSCRC